LAGLSFGLLAAALACLVSMAQSSSLKRSRMVNPKTGTDFEQKQTESTERRLEPEIFVATRRAKME
jgi:hypothetical protein